MAQRPDDRPGEPRMDPTSLYREEVVSDRKVGTIRVLTPIKSDGTTDSSRQVAYIGEAQLLTSVDAQRCAAWQRWPGSLLVLLMEWVKPSTIVLRRCPASAALARQRSLGWSNWFLQ